MTAKGNGTSPEKHLRVAYVGCGGIAARYLNVYREIGFVEVVACIDPDAAAAASAADFVAAAREGAAPRPLVSADFAPALADGIDLVVINTPNHLHRSQATEALRRGKHVFLQKPVAPNIADSTDILAASLESTGTCGLYMSYFDQPLFHDLKAMAAAGFFGKISHLYGRLMHRGGQVWSRQSLAGNRTWRDSAAQTGGGCFIQLAVHYIHLMEWLLEERIVRVSSVARNLSSPGLEGEDLAAAILEFESGIVATLDMAWNGYGEQFSVHGLRGSAEYLNNRFLLLESTTGPFAGNVVRYDAPAPNGNGNGHVLPDAVGREHSSVILPPDMGDAGNCFNQHRVFLEAIRDGRAPFVSVASGIDDLRVVDAVYESVRRGVAVEVDRSPIVARVA